MRYAVKVQFANNSRVLEVDLEGSEVAGLVEMFAIGLAGEHESVEAGNAPSEGRALSLSVEELS